MNKRKNARSRFNFLKLSVAVTIAFFELTGIQTFAAIRSHLNTDLMVTEEDRARIKALDLDPLQESLVDEFVHLIRLKAAEAGVQPQDFLPPMPSGQDGDEYSKYRLALLKEKREAALWKVKSWARKNQTDYKPGSVTSKPITRSEAMIRIATMFESDPLKQGQLYSKLQHKLLLDAGSKEIPAYVQNQSAKQLKVSPEVFRRKIAMKGQDVEEDYELATVQEIFGTKKTVKKKKKNPKAIRAEQRARAEAERRNRNEEERLIKRQKLLEAREQSRQKREELIAERKAKKEKLLEERYSTPYSRNEKDQAIEKVETEGRTSALNDSAPSPQPKNNLTVSPSELVSKDKDATLKVKEIFQKTKEEDIRKEKPFNPSEFYKELKQLENKEPAPGEKAKANVSFSPGLKSFSRFQLAFLETIISSSRAESLIPKNISGNFNDSDLIFFRTQSKKLEELKNRSKDLAGELELNAQETLKDLKLFDEAETRGKDSDPEESQAGKKEAPIALTEEEEQLQESAWLSTFFISESMGEDKVKALLDAYAGDNTVRFVLKGFKGEGTINEGLKWILNLALGMSPQPNIVIDPELFKRYSVTAAPTMLLEKVENVSEAARNKKEREIARVLSKLAYAVGLSGDQAMSVVDQITKEQTLSNPLRRKPALIVSGVTSRDWAVHKARSRAEFNQGVQGEVFDIIERDIEEIAQERLAKIDWEGKKREALNRFWTQQEKNYIALPLAQKDSERIVDPTIILNRDLYGADGKVIFKKGTRFNPFDAMPFTHTVIVFDASQPKQIEAVTDILKEEREQNRSVLLLASSFKSDAPAEQITELNNRWEQPVYLLTLELKERFQIRATLSVVRADNRNKVFSVNEIHCCPK